MAYKISLLLMSLAEQFSTGVYSILMAVWLFSVGYLMWKQFSRRLRRTSTVSSVHATLLEASQQAVLRS